jgi:hypothetical protein
MVPLAHDDEMARSKWPEFVDKQARNYVISRHIFNIVREKCSIIALHFH